MLFVLVFVRFGKKYPTFQFARKIKCMDYLKNRKNIESFWDSFRS